MSEYTQNTGVMQKKDSELVVIDLKRLWRAICKKLPLIIVVAILCGALALAGTVFLMTPQYQSSAMFYVNNNNFSLGDTEVSISSADISASKSLVKSYIVILNSRESLLDVIDYSGVNRTYGQLKGMISAEAVDSTEIFRVTVTSPDPVEAEQIANAIAYVLPKRIASVIEGSSAKVVDHAIVATAPSSPNRSQNTMLGLLLGLILSAGIVALVELFDVTIKAEEDISQCCTYPVLAAVPAMGADAKPSHNSRKYRGKHVAPSAKDATPVGAELNFVATEAYKLLRTKLQFSFTDESDSRVIVVSSAMEGEGKSLSAINIAYSMAQLDQKVLLVECDLRRPTVSEKIRTKKIPGLSNYLTGQVSQSEIFQEISANKSGGTFHVITAGSIPPNPVELLSSPKMVSFLQQMREKYDYILLDLPPVGEVSDAMVVAKMADGVLLLCRQNYCNRITFVDAIRQFEFIGARILGILVNGATEESGGYGRKYRYYKYRGYGKYGYGSRYSRYNTYATVQAEQQEAAEAKKK